MKYSAKDELLLMTEIWRPEISDDPLNFVKFVFPWGVSGTPLEGFRGPRVWQVGVLKELGEHLRGNRGKLEMDTLRLAIASGRGIGKSALVCWLVLWMLGTRIGSSVTVSANSESQLRSVTWGELAKWVTMSINAHWWDISATKLMPAKWLTELVERDLQKGTRYWAAEGKLWSEENPDSYAGIHNMDGMMLIFDEGSGIPSSIWNVGAGFFTENIPDRYWFAFSNPRRRDGYFYECFHGKRDFWRTKNIDARTVEDTDKQVYEQIIAEHGADSYQARVEVYGEFPISGDDQFISPADVAQAMARPRYEDETAALVMGVDVARFGTDKTVIAVRKGRDLIETHKFAGLDTMQVVGKVIQMINTHQPALTVVDEGGLGAGVVDRLIEQRFKVRGVNFGSRADDEMWGNKRSEMWGAMREWIKTASIGSGDKQRDRELTADLVGPTYKLNSQGATMLESKESMKKRGVASPDAADAVAVSFAYPVANTRQQPVLRSVQVVGKSRAVSNWMA